MSGTLRFGLLPDEGGQYLLVQHMGVAKTMDFLMLNRMVEAEEALVLGLVHEVVPADQLMDAAMDYARTLKQHAPMVLSTLKRFVGEVINKGPSEQAGIARRSTEAILDSQDKLEGIASFKEKRPPRFIGK